MAYTPELTYRSSCTLRRIAWALDAPMTKTIEVILEHMPNILDRDKVCKLCKDKSRCEDCIFNIEGGKHGKEYD